MHDIFWSVSPYRHIETLDESFTISVCEDNLIYEVKDKIKEKKSVTLASQTLTFRGETLDNETMLKNFKIDKHSVLKLHIGTIPGTEEFHVNTASRSVELADFTEGTDTLEMVDMIANKDTAIMIEVRLDNGLGYDSHMVLFDLQEWDYWKFLTRIQTIDRKNYNFISPTILVFEHDNVKKSQVVEVKTDEDVQKLADMVLHQENVHTYKTCRKCNKSVKNHSTDHHDHVAPLICYVTETPKILQVRFEKDDTTNSTKNHMLEIELAHEYNGYIQCEFILKSNKFKLSCHEPVPLNKSPSKHNIYTAEIPLLMGDAWFNSINKELRLRIRPESDFARSDTETVSEDVDNETLNTTDMLHQSDQQTAIMNHLTQFKWSDWHILKEDQIPGFNIVSIMPNMLTEHELSQMFRKEDAMYSQFMDNNAMIERISQIEQRLLPTCVEKAKLSLVQHKRFSNNLKDKLEKMHESDSNSSRSSSANSERSTVGETFRYNAIVVKTKKAKFTKLKRKMQGTNISKTNKQHGTYLLKIGDLYGVVSEMKKTLDSHGKMEAKIAAAHVAAGERLRQTSKRLEIEMKKTRDAKQSEMTLGQEITSLRKQLFDNYGRLCMLIKTETKNQRMKYLQSKGNVDEFQARYEIQKIIYDELSALISDLKTVVKEEQQYVIDFDKRLHNFEAKWKKWDAHSLFLWIQNVINQRYREIHQDANLEIDFERIRNIVEISRMQGKYLATWNTTDCQRIGITSPDTVQYLWRRIKLLTTSLRKCS